MHLQLSRLLRGSVVLSSTWWTQHVTWWIGKMFACCMKYAKTISNKFKQIKSMLHVPCNQPDLYKKVPTEDRGTSTEEWLDTVKMPRNQHAINKLEDSESSLHSVILNSFDILNESFDPDKEENTFFVVENNTKSFIDLLGTNTEIPATPSTSAYAVTTNHSAF